MLRHLFIAPLSLLIVMILYFGMHGLLNQPQSIEFLENKSEFSFDNYQIPKVVHICGYRTIGKPLTKSELWSKTHAILQQYEIPICEGYNQPPNGSSTQLQQLSQAILDKLIPIPHIL